MVSLVASLHDYSLEFQTEFGGLERGLQSVTLPPDK